MDAFRDEEFEILARVRRFRISVDYEWSQVVCDGYCFRFVRSFLVVLHRNDVERSRIGGSFVNRTLSRVALGQNIAESNLHVISIVAHMRSCI